MIAAAETRIANPADDRAFTKPLVKALRHHVENLTAPGGHRDAAEPAAAWVYMTVLAAWAEDHGLTGPWLREAADGRQAAYLAGSSDGARGWLARTVHALAGDHPATWCLLDPRYTRMRDAQLGEDAARELLRWWREDAPSLRYETGTGPGSLSGWIPGELLQSVGDTRRKGNALVQTPWWVADFILARTLRPAAAAFPDTTLRLVDPACGTGHFLIRAVDRLWELYTTGAMTPYRAGGAEPEPEPVGGWTPVSSHEAARRILAGVDGCEIDPLTAAVARLRLTTALAGHMAASGVWPRLPRLAQVPRAFRPRVVVGDSLLLGEVSREKYRKIHPALYGIYESEVELFGQVAWPGDPEPGGPPPVAMVK